MKLWSREGTAPGPSPWLAEYELETDQGRFTAKKKKKQQKKPAIFAIFL